MAAADREIVAIDLSRRYTGLSFGFDLGFTGMIDSLLVLVPEMYQPTG